MSTKLNPYLTFRDNARQAMEFYHSVLGGELTLTTFGESGAGQDPADQDKIMHAMLLKEDGMTLMASDTPKDNDMGYKPGSTISISLSGDDEAQLRQYWEGLSADGNVAMPLERAPWGDIFGMATDRFGVSWLVNITPAAS